MPHRVTALLLALASLALVAGEPDATYHGGGALPVEAANEAHWVDGRWSQVDVGPFLSIGLPMHGGHINKGIVVRLGDKDEAAVCFDSKNLGVRAAWFGGFLKFDGARFGLARWPQPASLPFVIFPEVSLWGGVKGRYNGLHLHGKRVIFDYRVDDMDVLESPWIEKDGEAIAVTRTFQIAPSTRKKNVAVFAGSNCTLTQIGGAWVATVEEPEGSTLSVAVFSLGCAAFDREKAHVSLVFKEHAAPARVKILMWCGKKADLAKFTALLEKSPAPEDLTVLLQAGPARWGAPIMTKGKVSAAQDAYVIDTITAPYDNPFKGLLFMSGLDFFSNGDAAICTLHGDVWRVTGLDATLEHVTWQRYATGMFEPLGLKIVDDKVYVLGRDQITRLHDLNGDGEADFYENFNNDASTSAGNHDFSACLETDRAGNFYHVDPYGVHRISKDGKTYETIAAGWRNPIAMAVGPDDSITVSPQEGNWTPSSEICAVKRGGWYGYPGPKATAIHPQGYEPPLCYIPHKIENSTGGHVWVASDKWGPFNGKMLNLSFGQAIVQLVLRETVDGVDQGGVVNFPLRFLAGTVRGRFRAQDGQLYVVGTKGWQTVAPADGAFQRMRYTGAAVVMPTSLSVHADGIRIEFTEPLLREEAEDAGNYSIEQWAYKYGKQYGSEDWSIANPEQRGRDEVKLESVKLGADGRAIFLKIPGLKPVMQMQIKYKIKSAAGATVRGDVYNTINKVGP